MDGRADWRENSKMRKEVEKKGLIAKERERERKRCKYGGGLKWKRKLDSRNEG